MSRRTLKPFLEILNEPRRRVFSELPRLPRGGVLGGGTALALQIGHRRSYDFDVFYSRRIGSGWLRQVSKTFGARLIRPVVHTDTELTVTLASDIKLTLLQYPFPALHPLQRIDHVSLFDVRDLASSKAYTIGRRGAWRDYVDLFFLLRDHLPLAPIVLEAKHRFKGLFDEKLFLQQLTYFDDITDRTVEFVGSRISQKTIESFFCARVKQFVDEEIFQ